MDGPENTPAAAAAHPPPDRPYPGLRPFRLKDSPLFFGRSRERIQVLELLENSPFLAVLGSSGSGKSSLVLSGLLPDIASGKLLLPRPTEFDFTDFRPGGNPYAALAEALWKGPLADAFPDALLIEEILRRSPLGLVQVLEEAWQGPAASGKERALVVVVDQFEEFFRFAGLMDRSKDRTAAVQQERDFHLVAGNMNEAQAFVDLLLEATRTSGPRIYVVLTMRSDFYKHCESFDGLPRMIAAHQYLAPRMDRRQLEDAIRLPLRAFGWEIEDKLVNWMLNDVQGEYDQLPILQHALFCMWIEATKDPARRSIHAADYEAIGKLDGALNNHGNELIGQAGMDQSGMARLFRCLGDFDPVSGEAIRRPRLLGQVVEESGLPRETVVPVVNLFRSNDHCFLMPPPHVALEDSTVVDLTHECLLRKWQDLKTWMKLERGKARELLRLKERATDLGWDGNANQTGTHLSRLELARFRQELVGDLQLNPGWGGRYQADPASLLSLLAKEEEHFAEEDKLARQRRIRRVAVAVAALLAAVIGFSWIQQNRVQLERKEKEAEVYRITAAKTNEEKRLIAEKALAEAERNELLSQENEQLKEQRYTLVTEGEAKAKYDDLQAVAKELIAGRSDFPPELLAKLRNLELLKENTAGDPPAAGDSRIRKATGVGPLSAKVDSVALASGAAGAPILLTGADQLRITTLGTGLTVPVKSDAKSQSVQHIAVSELEDSKGSIVTTNAGPDLFYTEWHGSEEPTLKKISTDTPGVVRARWIPGKKILFCTTDGRIGILSPAEAGNRPELFKTPHAGIINDLVLDQSSSRFLTSGDDGQAVLWRLENGKPRQVAACKRDAPVRSASFSPDGKKILLPSGVKAIQLINVEPEQSSPDLSKWPAALLPHDRPVLMGSFSPNGRWIATADAEIIYIRDATGAGIGGITVPSATMRGHIGRITAIAWSPAEDGIASADESGTVILWRLRGGVSLAGVPISMPSHQKGVRSLAWAADGSAFVSGGEDGYARVNPTRQFIKGTFKTFGGPEHKGSGDAALLTDVLAKSPQFAELFRKGALDKNPVLLALNPQAAYVAARWSYSATPAEFLRTIPVTVRNPANGKSEPAQAIDWGPNETTGKAADLSPGLVSRLELGGEAEVELEIPLLQKAIELRPAPKLK